MAMKRKPQAARRITEALSAATAALGALKASVPEVARAAQRIARSRGDIIVTGIGKSGFIGQKLTASLTSLGRRAFYLHPTDALHGDLGMLSRGDVLVALSFSGESKEVVSIARYAKKNFGVPVIALSKRKDSALGKVAAHTIPVPVTKEGSPGGIAPMASTTAMLVLCDMLAAAVAGADFRNERFAAYHPGGALGLSLKKVKDYMASGAAVPKISGGRRFIDAVKEINRKGLGITAVVGPKGELTGVITDGDVRRYFLRRGTKEALAKDAATRRPKCVREDNSLGTALSLMEKNKITSMFVVNGRGRLVGVLHIHSIMEEAM